MNNFSRSSNAPPLGHPAENGCPDFSPMRGVVWGVIFSSPFWLLIILIVLGSMK